MTVYSIIGLGKLGASMAAGIALQGHHVIGVDINEETIRKINNGHAPVQETNLEETIAANSETIEATTSHKKAVLNSDVSFVIVPTPSDERGAFSLQYAKWAFQAIGRALAEKKGYHLVVLTSTVLPGSTRHGLIPILERESKKVAGRDFGVCYSPEFIALGSIIHDFLNPDFTLVGEFDEKAGDQLEAYYAEFMQNSPPCKRMTIENAELVKVSLNTYVTTKISFANMLAELCENIPGGDVDIVTDALGTDKRIGHLYLKGALGYGGPCFPRDNIALSYMADALGQEAALAKTTNKYNRALPAKFVDRVKEFIRPGDTVAILGLAYKPYSHVVEESQAVLLARALSKMGVRVVAFDPLANESARGELRDQAVILSRISDCLNQADVVIIATPDPIFRSLSFADFQQSSSPIVTVIDCWRLLTNKFANQTQIRYVPIGRSMDDEGNAKRLKALWNN